MARLIRLATLMSLLAMPLALGGCAVALVGGLAAAGGVGYAAGQERGVGGAASDFTIKTNIEKAFTQTDPRLQIGITTNVYNGRVLLTGHVASPGMKATAEQIAGRVPGVRALYDELEIASAENVWNDTKDAWITAQVRSKMVGDGAIRSVNYTIDTENGAVFLIGSARSQVELDHATKIARYVPGVRRVVSYVELRTGAPVAAMPPRAYGPAQSMSAPPMSAPPTQYSAPQAAIEVQKL
jgi:osmotically-inducible protein OsmY